MKRKIRIACGTILAATVGFVALGNDEKCPISENVRGHENIEWSTSYAYGLTDETCGLPRVLLVGDSICNEYQRGVRERLKGKMNVTYWVSSYCVTSPAYLSLLSIYLDEAKYDVIHFNNGHHTPSKTPMEAYVKGLEAAVELIRRKQPQAKLVWCSTTPLKSAAMTARCRERNEAAAKAMAKLGGVATDDLFALCDPLDRESYWRDNHHFRPAAIAMQAAQVAASVLAANVAWTDPKSRRGKTVVSRTEDILPAVLKMSGCCGGTVELADGTYHFYSSSATNMRFHVSNHDQPETRPVFLPFIGVTNVAVVAKNAKFVMHGMGTAILVRDSLGFSFKGITVEWEKPFFAKAEIIGFEGGKTRVRFSKRDAVAEEGGRLYLSADDWRTCLAYGTLFDRNTHEIVERTADVAFGGGRRCDNGDFLLNADFSRVGAGAKVGDVYVMRSGHRPHPIVCLNRAKDTVFEDFVFRDGFGMGILAQKSENVTLRGGGCYPRDRGEYSSNTIDATHFSNCRGTVTVENCRFEGMMDDALNVHSTCLGIVAKPSDDTIRCRYMHPQAIGFGVFSPGDAVRFIAGRTLENGFVGRVKSVVTHDEREITLVLEQPIPQEYGAGDAVENADWQCAVVFRNNTVANNRARGVLFTTPKRIVCEGNFFDHVSGSAILLAGDAQGWYESGACEDLVIRKNRFRDCLTSVFQYCDAIVSIHPEVKDLASQRRRYHRNILIEDNDIETFDVPLLFALSAENVTWRNNRVKRHDRYCGWGRKPFESIGCGNVKVEGVDGPLLLTWQGETEVRAVNLEGVGTEIEKGVGTWNAGAI